MIRALPAWAGWLRRCRLDELPQLVNIFHGDMTLVGPRPEMVENVEKYKAQYPAFVYRERMKAGLTGYAQIEGKYNTTPEDKLMLDLMYIESFSIWLDVKLLFRTLTVFFKADSTEGFDAPASGRYPSMIRAFPHDPLSQGFYSINFSSGGISDEKNVAHHGGRSGFPLRRRRT